MTLGTRMERLFGHEIPTNCSATASGSGMLPGKQRGCTLELMLTWFTGLLLLDKGRFSKLTGIVKKSSQADGSTNRACEVSFAVMACNFPASSVAAYMSYCVPGLQIHSVWTQVNFRNQP